MHTFYQYLKGKGPDYQPTEEEKLIAKGEKELSTEHLRQVSQVSGTLEAAFARQTEIKVVQSNYSLTFSITYIYHQTPWDQALFERKITEWVAADDIPFAEIEKPYFRALMQYASRSADLKIPSPDGIRRRVLKMGDDSVDNLKQLIKVCMYASYSYICSNIIQNLTSKVSLSLDAWTSSNGYAFLAIVMHYVSNEWTQGIYSCLQLRYRY